MSVFDNNILDKVPEEAIWDWLNTNMSICYIQNARIAQKYFNIEDNIIKPIHSWTTFTVIIKEPIPSYIKFDKSYEIQTRLRFTTKDFKKEFKDIPFTRIESALNNDSIKSYDDLFLEKSPINTTIEFLTKQFWKLDIMSINDLKEITIKCDNDSWGAISIMETIKMSDIEDIKNIIKEFSKKTPNLIRVDVFNTDTPRTCPSFHIQEGEVKIEYLN